MPELTTALAASGCKGLTVVFAFANGTTPASATSTAATAIATATHGRPGYSYVRRGTARTTSHMSSANTPVTTGGGIRCSSQPLTSVGSILFFRVDQGLISELARQLFDIDGA